MLWYQGGACVHRSSGGGVIVACESEVGQREEGVRPGPLPGEDTLFPFLFSGSPGVGESKEGRGEHLLSMVGLAAGLSWWEGFSPGLAKDGMFQKPVISVGHAHWGS